MADNDLYTEQVDDSKQTESGGVNKIQSINGVNGISGVSSLSSATSVGLGSGSTSTQSYQTLTSSSSSTSSASTTKETEDEAKSLAELQYSTGVARVADSEEAEEWVSARQLYTKSLGITEYDELRAKLHLRDDESFTDYYNRTHYIPEGYEMQAKLLLAEEKRKKLYAEVEAGNMSEEDFLYEAYGKDLLKEEGIDFSSSLYWYNRFKSGEYSDPRDNSTFMLQLIENARSLFEAETWYEAVATSDATDLAQYVTGEVLSADAVSDIFSSAFDQMSEYFENEEQIIKYYRAGLLQGFDPTIDADGDGKIDYYYSTDGKLYNVNETGEGANTMRAYYNEDGSLNRIVASDTIFGEVAGEAIKGFASFFTGVVDFFGMIGGAIWDLGEGIFTGEWDLSATTEVTASLGQFWNSTYLGSQDYVTSSGFTTTDGKANWAGIARGGARLAGTIAAFVATMGLSSIGGGASAASQAGGQAVSKGLFGTVKQGFKTLTTSGLKKGLGVTAKGLLKSAASTAVRLTSWANGTAASNTLGAIVRNSATTAFKDAMQGAVSLSVNAGMLYENGVTDHVMTSGEIFGQAMGTFGVEFVVGATLRSAVGTTAFDRLSGIQKGIKDGSLTLKTFWNYAPQSLKFAENSVGTVAMKIGNLAFDAVDNVVSQWAQSSLATKGKVLDMDTLGQVVNSPSLWMNIAYQTKSNIKDNWGVTSQDIVAANTDAAENILNLKGWVQKNYLDAEDDTARESWKAIATDIDQKLEQYTNETGSASAASLKVFEETSSKLGLFDTVNDWRGSNKKFTEEEIRNFTPTQKYAYDMYMARADLEFQYTQSMMDYINEYYQKYSAMSQSIIKGLGWKFIFGNDMKNYATKAAQAFQVRYQSDERSLEWDAAIARMFDKTDEMINLRDSLGSQGKEGLELLNDAQVTMGRMVKDADGKWTVEGGLAEALKDNPEALQKYANYLTAADQEGKLLNTTQDIYILTRNTGTSEDGNEVRLDSIKALDTLYKLYNVIIPDGMGENLLLKKFGDAYVVQFNGGGNQVLTMMQISGMLQSLTALKLAVRSSDTDSTMNSVQILRTFLSFLGESKADSDDVLKTDADVAIAAQTINEMLKSRLITYSEAAKLIAGLNEHLGTLNQKTDGPKKMIDYTDKLSAMGQLNMNKDSSVDMSEYAQAMRVLDAIDKIDDATDVINKLRTAKKEKAYKSSDLNKIQAAQDIVKNKSLEELLIKEGIITPNFSKTINSFQQGLKGDRIERVRASSTRSSELYSDDDAKVRESMLNEVVKKLDLVGEASKEELDISDITVGVNSEGTKTIDISLKNLRSKDHGFGKFFQAYTEAHIKEVPDKELDADAYEAFKQQAHAKYTTDVVYNLVDTYKEEVEGNFNDLYTMVKNRYNKLSETKVTTETIKDYFSNKSDLSILVDAKVINEADVMTALYSKRLTSPYTDHFKELENTYSVLNKNAVPLQDSEKVVIRLDEFFGKSWEKAMRKLDNPEIASIVASKESEADILATLFGPSEARNSTSQFRAWLEYKSIYGDELVLTKEEATKVLDRFGYNFNGDIAYVNSNKQIPGFYYLKGQQGYALGDPKNLLELERLSLANAPSNNSKTTVTISDAISKSDVLSSGVQFVTKGTKMQIDDIVLMPLGEDESDYASVINKIIIEKSNNKEGKAASKTKEANREISSYARSLQYNEDHKLALYTTNIIDALAKFHDPDSDIQENPLQIVVPKDLYEKQKVDYSYKLYETNEPKLIDDSYYEFTVTRKYKTSEEFKTAAYKLIADNNGVLDYYIIQQLIPNNISSPQRNTINAIGTGSSSLSNAQLISGYVYNYMRSAYDMDEREFFNILQLDRAVTVGDISEAAYQAALDAVKGKTIQEIIEIKNDSNNIFLEILRDTAKEKLAISNMFVEQITDIYGSDATSPDTPRHIAELFGSDDMRRNIGVAINAVLSVDTDSRFDSDGNLILTPELIQEIRSKIKTPLTSDTNINYKKALADDDALAGYISLLSIIATRRETTMRFEDSLENKVYAAVRSATSSSSDTAYISIKDLFRLSDDELDRVNDVLAAAGLSKIPQEVISTIKASNLRYAKKSYNPTTYRLEQTEVVSNSFDSSRGYIATEETLSESNNFKLDNISIQHMMERAAEIKNGDTAFKLSTIDQDMYSRNPIHLSLLKNSQGDSGVLNYVNYPSSLTRANFNYGLVEYRHINNIVNTAMDLKQIPEFSKLTNETLVDLTLRLYDYSTGTEMQSIRPEYVLVNSKDGSIIDITTYHDSDYPYDGLIGSILKNPDIKDTDVQIFKLKPNGFNTMYGEAVDPIEVYSLAENKGAILSMLNQRKEIIDSQRNFGFSDRDKSVAALSDYYAKIETQSPKFYYDQLRTQAAAAGVSTEAIDDFITSTKGLSVLGSTRTAYEEGLKTLIYGSSEDEKTYYALQQLRDMMSYGETEESFKALPGMEEAIQLANNTIDNSLTLYEDYSHYFKRIATAFNEGNFEKVSSYYKSFKDSLSPENQQIVAKEVMSYIIRYQDSISANLYKLTGGTLQDSIDYTRRVFSTLETFKWDNNENKVVGGDYLDLSTTVNSPKLVLDIESLYSKGVKSRIYQIAYKYGDEEGVIFLRSPNETVGNIDTQKLLERYPDFAKQYGENNSIKWFANGLPDDIKGSEKTLDDLARIIEQVKQDGGVLLGTNSNNFDIPNILADTELGIKLAGIKDLTYLDSLELSKRLYTTFNVTQSDHKLQLGEVAKQLGIQVDEAKQHDALYDIKLTEEVFNALAQGAITQDTHGQKFITDMQKLYTALEGKDLSGSDEAQLHILPFSGQGAVSEDVLQSISNIHNRYNDPDKLYKFSQITNTINNKLLNDYYHIRTKELRASMSNEDLHNATVLYSSLASSTQRDSVFNIISYALDPSTDTVNTSRDTLMKNMGTLASAICKEYNVKFLDTDTLINILKKPKEFETRMLARLGKTTEDLESFTEKNRNTLRNAIRTDYNDVTAKGISLDNKQYFLDKAVTPLYSIFDDTISRAIYNEDIKNIVLNRCKDSILRVYDRSYTVDENGNKVITPFRKSEVRNMLSKTEKGMIDYLKTSPLISTEYQNIYDIVGTSYGAVDLYDGTIEGKTSRLLNDTIYITPTRFAQLLGEDITSISTVLDTINMWRDYYGNENGEIYIPVLRHPRDNRDSLHFMKVEFLEKSDTQMDIMMNIDTMKSKFNGDFDGDHISLIKPTKFLNEYATLVNTYKNKAYSILDNTISELFTGTRLTDTDTAHARDYADTVEVHPNVLSDTTILKILKSDMATLSNLSNSKNILKAYETLRDNFVNNEAVREAITKRSPKTLTDSDVDDILKDIYLVEPIEIRSTNTSDASSFITFTEFAGMSTDENNVRAKTLYRNNSLSSALTLTKLDSASGEYQKDNLRVELKNRLTDGKLDLNDSALILSGTTRKIIDNNITQVKDILLKNIDTFTSKDIVTDLIKNAENARDIETVLRIEQAAAQVQMKKDGSLSDAINVLKEARKNDPDSIALQRYLDVNQGDDHFDDALSKFYYSVEDMEKLSEYTGNKLSFGNNKSGIGDLLDKAQKVCKTGMILINESDPEKQKLKSQMQTEFTELIKINDPNNTQIIPEDTFLVGDAASNKMVYIPKAIKLSAEQADFLKSKYFKDNQEVSNKILSDSTLKYLGLDTQGSYEIKLGYIDDNDVALVYSIFGLGRTKLGSYGNKKLKGTPSAAIDVNQFTEGMQAHLADIDIMRDASTLTQSGFTSGDSSILTNLENANSYICYDVNGSKLDVKEGTIPASTAYVVVKTNRSVLEPTAIWSKAVKSTPTNELDIANAIEDTGGLWQTKGMFVSVNNDGELEFDDQGYQSLMKRIADLESPNIMKHNASEPYELLRFALLTPYLEESDYDSYESKDAYILAQISKAFDSKTKNSYLRSLNEMLIHKYKDKLDYKKGTMQNTLLFDNELNNSIYSKVKTMANEDSDLTTKGSNKRNISSQSLFQTEETGGGELKKGLDIFTQSPDMSVIELINYLNRTAGNNNMLYETSMQALLEDGRLPVGTIYNSRYDGHNEISNDDNKIQQSFGALTRKFTGASILPMDEIKRNAVDEYDIINSLTGYQPKYSQPSKSNYNTKQAQYLILMLRALSGDENNTVTKYGMYDILSPSVSKYAASLDPNLYSMDSENGLVFSPKQFIDKSRQLDMDSPMTTQEFADSIQSMRATTDYHTNVQDVSDSLKGTVSDTIRGTLPSADSNPNVNYVDTRRPITELSDDAKVAAHEYSVLAQGLDDVQKLNEHQLIVGGKVVKQHKVFTKEKIMMNNGIKIKDADDLVQDRNIKQTIIDQTNYRDTYADDIVRLNNYATTHNTKEIVNESVYLYSIKERLNQLDSLISSTKDATDKANYQLEKESLQASISENFNVTTQKDIDARLLEIGKAHPTETYMVNKILNTLAQDSAKYNVLMREPSNKISFLLTSTASNNKKERKSLAKYVLGKIGSKDTKASTTTAEKGTIPEYTSFNFFDSVVDTVNQVAKRRAIYENAVRLRKSGVIDNSSTMRILNETIAKHMDTLQTLQVDDENGYMRDGLRSNWMYLQERLSPYLTDGSATADDLFNKIDTEIIDASTPIGQTYVDIFTLLNNVMKETGITYETAITDTTNSVDADRFLFCQDMIQDMFACMSHLTKDELIKDLTDSFISYAETNNLKMVDKFGKPIDPEKIYLTDNGSLSFLQRALDNRSASTYREALARDALNGELYFMDAGLVDAYSKTIFVEYKKPNWLMSTIRKTSNWCIKMLMASPFKLVDRFLKFSAFDMSTLGSANLGTFAQEGKAFTDLKAYFMSKGAYKSDDLTEFLETQGIRMNNNNFDLVLNTDSADSVGLFKSYQDATGNVFTFQSLSQRYAYWLATKESLKKGDYSVLGSAYHLKDAISKLDGITDSDGNTRVSKEGNQAAFAMAQMIGSPNDFPGVSKTLNKYGMVFTTFPLAAARWGLGEFRSMSAAVKDMFSEGITSQGGKWLLRQSSGIVGTFIAEQVLIALVCDMFGVSDEEDEEEWKKYGALPNLTQSIIQGQPIMDTFSSMNILREFYGLTLEPFLTQDDSSSSDDSDSGTNILSGFERYLNKNIISHINPIIKNIGEVVTKTDLIDDQVIDTSEKYNAFENVFRKLSSYVLGSAGANALTKQLQDSDNSLPNNFIIGMRNAINAELGNTKATKENNKNYYKMLTLVNSYIDYDSDTYTSNTGDFNYANYKIVKSKIYSLINNRASSAEVYKAITELTESGYTLTEIRAALKNCSLSEKINNLASSADFLDSLTESEMQNLSTALAYEEYMYPWLEDNVNSLTKQISSNSSYSSTPYIDYSGYLPNTYYQYTYSQPTYSDPSYSYFNYNSYYDPYDVYADLVEDLKSTYISSYNPYTGSDPMSVYRAARHTIDYNNQQLEGGY